MLSAWPWATSGGSPRITAEDDAIPTEADQPLVVYGPWSLRYDFGPGHPLTPRRFGPGISLLEAFGATRFEAPEPASDDDLGLVHTASYIDIVRRAGADPAALEGSGAWEDRAAYASAGLGPGDDPIFPAMHEAGAAVAGGSLMAMQRILDGAETHVFHPGGGLHHAMADHASGFCIYNDPALAIAKARGADLRVLYVDLDVHHGDGVQAAFWEDPAVMTVSLHESGHSLFPGTGFVNELGGDEAHGTKVNVPFEPGTSDDDWLAALERVVPPLARRHRPDVLVTQHGCDSHALDPLAHLLLTTNAYRRATVLLDEVAHGLCGGRWLATGGGGYDVLRVVPRSWALVWSAQAHIEPPEELPAAWRTRWEADAERNAQAPILERLLEAPIDGRLGAAIREQNRRTLESVVAILELPG